MTITGPTTSASDLTSGTLADARLSAEAQAAIAHMDLTDNPHEVTVEQIGAAGAVHQHNIGDVNDLQGALDSLADAAAAAQSTADNAASDASNAQSTADSASASASSAQSAADNAQAEIDAHETENNTWEWDWNGDTTGDLATLRTLILNAATISGFNTSAYGTIILGKGAASASIIFAFSVREVTSLTVHWSCINAQNAVSQTISQEYSLDDGVTWTDITTDASGVFSVSQTGVLSPTSPLTGRIKIRLTHTGSQSSLIGPTHIQLSFTGKSADLQQSLAFRDTRQIYWYGNTDEHINLAYHSASDVTLSAGATWYSGLIVGGDGYITYSFSVLGLSRLAVDVGKFNAGDSNARDYTADYSIDNGATWTNIATLSASAAGDGQFSGEWLPSTPVSGKVQLRFAIDGVAGGLMGFRSFLIAVDAIYSVLCKE